MRTDVAQQQLENQVEDYGVSGCLAWSRYSDLKRGGVPAILKHFQNVCQSEGFLQHCASLGFTNPSFHPNAGDRRSTIANDSGGGRISLSEGNAGYDKFTKGLYAPSDNDKAKEVPDGACLGLVFHGTPESNIDNILKNGLDESRRLGQAYGPGEYFSKEPTVSISYCKGGLEMLVFVVILPPTLDKKYLHCPPDYVVVENNQHHLALGVLKFQAVDKSVVQLSQERRAQFRALNTKVFVKGQIKQEAALKAKIIQHLIAGETDVAAEVYERKSPGLCALSKREISWYVHQKLDDEIIEWYFPDLPKPMDMNEIIKRKVQNYDDADIDEQKAKKELKDAQESVFGNLAPVLVSSTFANPGISLAVATNTSRNNTTATLNNQSAAAAASTKTTTAGQSSITTKPPSVPRSIVLDAPTQICKHLVANQVDLASELYFRSQKVACLDPASKKEIYDIAFRCVDHSLLDLLFPGLPQTQSAKTTM